MAENGIFFLAWLLNLKMVEVFACSDTTVPLAQWPRLSMKCSRWLCQP